MAPATGHERATATGHDDAAPGEAIRAEAWAARRARLRGFLQRGRDFKAWLAESSCRSTVTLAAMHGCSRARIYQQLALAELCPEIQADLDDEARTTPVPKEVELRQLAKLSPVDQIWKYGQLTGELLAVKDSRRVARLGGFQHLFARARLLRDRFDTGAYRTIAELGATEGLSCARASCLLNLLGLAPDIIARCDVPKAEAPPLTERELRRIARIVEHDAQRAAFERLLGEG
jgi:hypothetical protein